MEATVIGGGEVESVSGPADGGSSADDGRRVTFAQEPTKPEKRKARRRIAVADVQDALLSHPWAFIGVSAVVLALTGMTIAQMIQTHRLGAKYKILESQMEHLEQRFASHHRAVGDMLERRGREAAPEARRGRRARTARSTAGMPPPALAAAPTLPAQPTQPTQRAAPTLAARPTAPAQVNQPTQVAAADQPTVVTQPASEVRAAGGVAGVAGAGGGPRSVVVRLARRSPGRPARADADPAVRAVLDRPADDPILVSLADPAADRGWLGRPSVLVAP